MTPEEETHHHPTPQDPEPATLLPNRTATIQFDGLIMSAYDRVRRLYQAGVHVKAEHHKLDITVKRNGVDVTAEVLPDWDGELAAVKKFAPFWVYVDYGNGMPKTYNANLHKPKDPNDPLSFEKVFSFVRKHGRELKMNPGHFAVFNFPHGTAYSALNETAQLSEIEQGKRPTPLGDIDVSSLGAIDIADVSDGETKRELVFADESGKHVFFRLPLNADTVYEIKMENQPLHHHNGDIDPEEHFLQYYELFSLKPGEKRFLVHLRRPRPAHDGFESTDSPPCVGTSGGETGGLAGAGGGG